MRLLVRALPCAVIAVTAAGSSASAGTPLPPIRTPTDADITFAETARATSVDSAGRFTFSFGARAGTRGSVAFSTSKKVLKLGRKSFRVADDGTATVTYRLTRADRAALRAEKKLRVKATVASTAGEKAKRTFTLRASAK